MSKCSKDTGVAGTQIMVLEGVGEEIGDELREVRREDEMMMGLLGHRIDFGFSSETGGYQHCHQYTVILRVLVCACKILITKVLGILE